MEEDEEAVDERVLRYSSCCVSGCHNDSNSLCSLFEFPESDEKTLVQLMVHGMVHVVSRKRAWEIKALDGDRSTKLTRICSMHFEDEDFIFRDGANRKKDWLKKKAVPTKNLPEPTSTYRCVLDENHFIVAKDDAGFLEESSEDQDISVSSNTDFVSKEVHYTLERDYWPCQKTLCLIRNWAKHKSELTKVGYGKKNKIWNRIAEIMRLEGWKNISGRDCDRKWRRLKNQYKALRKRKTNGKSEKTHWKYYKVLHDLLKDDHSFLRDFTKSRVVFLPTKCKVTGDDDITVVHLAGVLPQALPKDNDVPKCDPLAKCEDDEDPDDPDDPDTPETPIVEIEEDEDSGGKKSSDGSCSDEMGFKVSSNEHFSPSNPPHWFAKFLAIQQEQESLRRKESSHIITLLKSIQDLQNQQLDLLKSLFPQQ